MKVVNKIFKIVAALAAVAGAVYVVATYGDQIVAWCKKFIASLPCCKCCQDAAPVAEEDFADMDDAVSEEDFAAPAEETTEAPAEEAAAPIENESDPVAEDADFEG